MGDELLCDAHKHPEAHRRLMVRVVGYSDFLSSCAKRCRMKSSALRYSITASKQVLTH
ncbi:glycine radical domain-containing protein [Kistimonas scapharcae]|uniref:glycine radical domain-containing protein n=1 Tax=Kistimonas scapharcae TaxID=1036133 RepID=UPI003CD0BF69